PRDCAAAGAGYELVSERLRQLYARADPQLAVHAREVDLDRLRGDEESLGNLAVGWAFRRQCSNTPLARGERLDPPKCEAPGPCPRGEQLGLGARGKRSRAADRRQLDRTPKLLARLRAPIGAAKRGSQLRARLRVLELGRRVREHLDRLLEQREPGGT